MNSPPHSPTERVLSIPNALTLARLPLAGLLWLRPHDLTFALAVMVAAALTDTVDGRFARALRRRRARRRGETERDGSSPVGEGLDPACDKVFVLSAVAAVAWALQAPLPAVLLIATRELGVIPPLILYRLMWRERLHYDFRAGRIGKVTTVCQFAAIGSMLVAPRFLWPLAALCGFTGALTIADYAYRGWRLVHAEPAPDSAPPS